MLKSFFPPTWQIAETAWPARTITYAVSRHGSLWPSVDTAMQTRKKSVSPRRIQATAYYTTLDTLPVRCIACEQRPAIKLNRRWLWVPPSRRFRADDRRQLTARG